MVYNQNEIYLKVDWKMEIIELNIDDLGFTILITEAEKESGYAVWRTYFINHSSHIKFLFLDSWL